MLPLIKPHAPQSTVLHWIVRTFYDTWLAHRTSTGRTVSPLVRRAFERFLRCGDPSFGYAVLGCDSCGFLLGIASSCKGRAWCPHCLSRRQAALSRHLVDDIFGPLPVRHWVLCLPPCLRYTLGYDPAVLSATLNAFVKAIFKHLRWRAKRTFKLRSVSAAQVGAVSFIHRCSGNVDTNIHFHCLVPDGAFIQASPGGRFEFRVLSPPSDEELERVALDACWRTCKALAAKHHWSWTSGQSSGSTIEGVLTFARRKGLPVKFFGQAARHGEGGVAPRDRAYAFHLNADHLVEAGDRRAFTELVEYVLAPPILDEQLFVTKSRRVGIRMKRARHDRTTVEVIHPYVFLNRLAVLVPRPRSNAVRYHGVYASNASIREQVVPWRGFDEAESSASIASDQDTADERRAKVALHARHDPPAFLSCPCCRMRLHVVEVATPRFRYRKPGWRPPNESPAPRIQDRLGQALEVA